MHSKTVRMFKSALYTLPLAGILLLPLQHTFSQTGYIPGYVVLNSNDTIYGTVKDRNNGSLFKKIKFKDHHGKTHRFGPGDILMYQSGPNLFESIWYRDDSVLFIPKYYSRPNQDEKVFLKVLAKGELSCYAMEFIHVDSDVLDQFELFKREGASMFARATQGIFGLKRKALASYFHDCPELVKKINGQSLKTPLEVTHYYNTHCGNAQQNTTRSGS
ncbi:MAG: hypothetical protein AB3N16_11905 [Flavobacteriaceae bacterium]